MVSARVACLLPTLAILCAPYIPSSAQNQESIFERIRLEHDEIEKSAHQQSVFALSSLVASSVESQSIDVKHYRLQIHLIPSEFSTAGVVTGAVSIIGETTGTVSVINVDAQPNLNIDSVTLDGSPNNFRRNNRRVVISLPAPAVSGRPFAIVIQYHGASTGSGGLGGAR